MLGIPAAFISHVPNAEIRRIANVKPVSSTILARQLALLGHVLRKDQNDPDRLVCFEPRHNLAPRHPTGVKRKHGVQKGAYDWGQRLLQSFHTHLRLGKADLRALAQDRGAWGFACGRLCSAAERARV